MPITRWNDDRLDDVHRRVIALENQVTEHLKIREELVDLRGRLREIAADAHECRNDVKQLKADNRKRDEEQRHRDEMQHQERKADRKWMILTALTAAGLVIAALGIFIG